MVHDVNAATCLSGQFAKHCGHRLDAGIGILVDEVGRDEWVDQDQPDVERLDLLDHVVEQRVVLRQPVAPLNGHDDLNGVLCVEI